MSVSEMPLILQSSAKLKSYPLFVQPIKNNECDLIVKVKDQLDRLEQLQKKLRFMSREVESLVVKGSD